MTDSWRVLQRTTGLCGLVGVVLLFAPVIAISTLGEPAFDGTSEEVADFFRAAGDSGWYQFAEATFAVAMLALLWYFVGLTTLLRRAEGEPGWRSTGALLSGLLLVAYGTVDSSWEAAAHRGGDTDPTVALFAFDTGNLGFANAWLAMASFALATGWVLYESRALPRWCAWWAVAVGIGLVVTRYVWESSLWMLPYALFWVGAIGLAVRLVRQRDLAVAPTVVATTATERTHR
jgi:hypothetical protein